MSVRETYSGKYLAEADLQKKEHKVIIENIGKDEFDVDVPGSDKKKQVKKNSIGFQGQGKRTSSK